MKLIIKLVAAVRVLRIVVAIVRKKKEGGGEKKSEGRSDGKFQTGGGGNRISKT